MKKYIVISVISLSMISCASYFKRKECEKTNWFQHGQDVAMRGQNLENDNFLSECRKVEAEISSSSLDLGFKKGRANYCEPETVYLTGKKGEPFSAGMCDGANLKILRAKHLEGAKEFCQPDNGESAGATGKLYQNVCPKEMEARFLVEFKKGRKKYLVAEVDTREIQIQDIDREVRDLDREQKLKTIQLMAMGNGGNKVITRKRRVVSAGGVGTVDEQVQVEEDLSVKTARNNLQNEINSLNSQINYKRKKQTEIREEIRKLRSEMLTL